MGEVAKKSYLRIAKVTTVFQKYPWKSAVDRLISFEIRLNFLI